MSYQAVFFAVTVGVAIGLAVYNYFATPVPVYTQAQPKDINYTFEPRTGETRRRRKSEQNKDVCSICLVEVDGNRRQLTCGHMFHPHCISKWLRLGKSCPNCRVGC